MIFLGGMREMRRIGGVPSIGKQVGLVRVDKSVAYLDIWLKRVTPRRRP
jgi:hypothetical protein